LPAAITRDNHHPSTATNHHPDRRAVAILIAALHCNNRCRPA